jgi:ubiquinol-cytochrome c reductase cytochrome b subunit
MSLTFMVVALINGGNDLIATHFNLSINQIMWATRISIIILPPLAYIITKRVCLSLQRYDRELVLHGRETGRLVMLPHGEYIEVHEPISPEKAYMLTQHEQPLPLQAPEPDENGVAPRGGLKNKVRSRLSKAILGEQISKPTPEDVKALEGGHH